MISLRRKHLENALHVCIEANCVALAAKGARREKSCFLSFLIFTLVDFSPFRTRRFSREITCELCWCALTVAPTHSRSGKCTSFFFIAPKLWAFSNRMRRRMTPTIAADVEKCFSVALCVGERTTRWGKNSTVFTQPKAEARATYFLLPYGAQMLINFESL